MNEKNTGVTYETLTQGFFQAILDQDAVRNVRVERNVKLAGQSGTQHQIDVYWSFEVGAIRYQTIVQCKDWNSRVKQEQVLAFSAVLEDIPGQPRGIMVSKHGFQSGAEKVAKAHGISLYRLREADEDYWAGRIREIHINMRLVVPRIQNVVLNFDMNWISNRKTELGLDSVTVEFGGLAGEAQLILEDGRSAGTVAQALLSALPKDGQPHPMERREKSFDAATFLVVPASPIGSIKLLSILFDGGQSVLEQKMLIDGADAIRFVLESFDGLHVYTADNRLQVTNRSASRHD